MIGKCKLCGRELKNKRACHGHLMTNHSSEYRAAGMDQSKFIQYYDDKEILSTPNNSISPAAGETHTQSSKDLIPGKKPRGLRHLNVNNRDEYHAHLQFDDEFGERYEYIDIDNNVYTQAELIQKGWL